MPSLFEVTQSLYPTFWLNRFSMGYNNTKWMDL